MEKENLFKRTWDKTKTFILGTIMAASPLSSSANPTSSPEKSPEKTAHVLDAIMTFDQENASPIQFVAYHETHGSTGKDNNYPASARSASGAYFGLIQMSSDIRKNYFAALNECNTLTDEQFAEKYNLTNLCSKEEISYWRKGFCNLAAKIGKGSASSAKYQAVAKKYPEMAAKSQELFACNSFYAEPIAVIQKEINKADSSFNFSMLHPLVQNASIRILALGQNKHAPLIGQKIAKYLKSSPNAKEELMSDKVPEKLSENILSPRPGVMKRIKDLKDKPIDFWMEAEYLYNLQNHKISGQSWFDLRRKENQQQQILAKSKEEIQKQSKENILAKSLVADLAIKSSEISLESLQKKINQATKEAKIKKNRNINIQQEVRRVRNLAELKKKKDKSNDIKNNEITDTNDMAEIQKISGNPPFTNEGVTINEKAFASHNKVSSRKAKAIKRREQRYEKDPIYREAVNKALADRNQKS